MMVLPATSAGGGPQAGGPRRRWHWLRLACMPVCLQSLAPRPSRRRDWGEGRGYERGRCAGPGPSLAWPGKVLSKVTLRLAAHNPGHAKPIDAFGPKMIARQITLGSWRGVATGGVWKGRAKG